ncbi:hypothetical protein SKAU_G00201900 [Synaphobranchus kaupii]|uniref:DBIRD complex subunit ZNF326 n=1 Tax=Synaphobranchus kaupii TaxID=118154 RepID=A0A9Q1FFR4_SYNKA|nr:hypothetical protein SKAU_G00201900 [Synaphobranchus kaupii]
MKMAPQAVCRTVRFSAEMIRGNPRGRFPGLVSRPYEASYVHEYESYTETDDTMAPSSGNGEVSRGYVRTRLAPPHPQPTEYYGLERSSSQRSGPYESYDSGSSKGSRDLFRSGGFRSSFDGGYDSSSPSNRFYSEESSWDSSYPSSATRSGFSDNDGGGGYSSYSSSDSPHTKLAPFGSRGRGMPAYPQNSFGGRSNDVGGPPAFRGRGRGFIAGGSGVRQPVTASPRPQTFRPMDRSKPTMGHYGTPRPEFYGGYQNPAQPAARGMKRKMVAPPPPAMMVKKQKPFPVVNKTVMNSPTEGLKTKTEKDDETDDSAESKQRKARRDKQKRKRVKEIEKYGDMHRLAFTCAFCKVRTCEDKEIEDHFASTFHQQTLAHIQKQTKFDDKTMAFLHESMVNKFRKNVLRKRTNAGAEPSLEEIQRELSKVVVEEVCLSKVEMILCLACHTHIPAALISLQNHLQSSEHLKNKSEFTETQRRESVLSATSIMTNPIVKARFEKYLKGENPFDDEIKEAPEDSQHDQAEDDLNDSTE